LTSMKNPFQCHGLVELANTEWQNSSHN